MLINLTFNFKLSHHIQIDMFSQNNYKKDYVDFLLKIEEFSCKEFIVFNIFVTLLRSQRN